MKNKETKNILAPKLRFPEFRDAVEWEEKQLKELCTINKGEQLAASEKDKCGNYPHYNGGMTPSSHTHKSNEKANTIIISEGGNSCGYVQFVTQPFWCGGHCYAVNPKNIINTLYLYFSLQAKQQQIMALRVGSGLPNIQKSNLEKFELLFSKDILEQQKIADCLSSLDDVINAQSQKLEALIIHKKGLMQQLFPTEDEAVPKFRFSEFRNKGEWKMQKISGLLSRIAEPVTVKFGETYYEIGIRSHGKGIFHKEAVTGKALGNKRVFHVKENAFIVNIVFAWEQAIAVTSAAENGMIASHRFPMYKAKENKADINFIKYFFLTNKGKNLLWIASPGGAGRNKTLGQKEFEKLELLLPKDVKEQTAIACCLSSIDELITIQVRKIDTLKAHKKGLMQQLFPNIND